MPRLTAEHTEFMSPLTAAECAQRLQQLAAQSRYVVTRHGRPVRLVLAGLALALDDEGAYTFRLNVRGRGLGSPGGATSGGSALSGIAFLRLRGRLTPAGASTDVDLAPRAGLPATARDWALQVAWYVVWALAIGGSVVAALVTGNARFWEAAGIFALVLALLYGILALTYAQAAAATTALLARVLGSHVANGAAVVVQLDPHRPTERGGGG